MEKAKGPELLQQALTEAMSRFASKAQEGMASDHTDMSRRSSIENTSALSTRRVELEAELASGATSSSPYSLRVKVLQLRSFISRLHSRVSSSSRDSRTSSRDSRTSSRDSRTSSRVAVALPARWEQVWNLLITDTDPTVREAAHQARQILHDPAPKARTPKPPYDLQRTPYIAG